MNLIDEVYSKVKNEVFKARYKPNQLIVERDIMETYGISKITAGKVLNRLCHEGHLTSYPRSGYMVRTLTPQEMKQLSRLRVAVESLVLEILTDECSAAEVESLRTYIKDDFGPEDSASAINNEFHMAMARMTNDRYVISLLDSILGSVSRVEQPVSFEKHGGWQNFHLQIIAALREHDPQRAKHLLKQDIDQR